MQTLLPCALSEKLAALHAPERRRGAHVSGAARAERTAPAAGVANAARHTHSCFAADAPRAGTSVSGEMFTHCLRLNLTQRGLRNIPQFRTSCARNTFSTLKATVPGGDVTRRALLTWLTVAVAGSLAPRACNAAAGTALTKKLYPKPGYNVEEQFEAPPLSEQDVARVQKQLAALREYRQAVSDISAKFEAAPDTYDVLGELERVFRYDTLRNVLNVVADTNFDEEVQKRTDRLVRNILQDLSELETAARIRGNQGRRTPRKTDAVRKWLRTFSTDMDRLLAYYPKAKA